MRSAARPKTTVVTPCFNSDVTIRETLESVRDQDCQNIEHLVYEGGSKDGTLDIPRGFPHLKRVLEKAGGPYHT